MQTTNETVARPAPSSEFLVPSAVPVAEPIAPEPVVEAGPGVIVSRPGDPLDIEILRDREAEVTRRERAIHEWIAEQREHAGPLSDQNVESMIASEYAICAWDAFQEQANITPDAERALRCVTIVVMVLRNGFTVTGSSACAAPDNYDANEGRKEARADALSKLWLCAEYANRNRLAGLDVVDYPDFNPAPIHETPVRPASRPTAAAPRATERLPADLTG